MCIPSTSPKRKKIRALRKSILEQYGVRANKRIITAF